ncbi:MAG: ACP S-malonyltransferase [Clostridiales bacterium]|nr:ACP S-malonyltransferase [Clostridiales bacterium]
MGCGGGEVVVKLAALFSGQGAQKVGMGKDAYEAFPEAREIFQRADEALGFSLSSLIFEGPEEKLRWTEYTQPALLTVGMALYAISAARGFRPQVAAGLSLGEYTAAVAAGVLSLEDGVRLVQKRGRYMQEAVPEGKGAMAAIMGLSDEEVEEGLQEVKEGLVVAANYNCPGQVVISGEREAVERAVEILKARGARRSTLLPVSAPFHSPLMAPAAQRLKADLMALSFRDAAFPIVSNVDGQPRQKGEAIREALLRQVEAPVRWSQGLWTMEAMGVEGYVEFGPGGALVGFVKRTLSGRPALAAETGEKAAAWEAWAREVFS